MKKTLLTVVFVVLTAVAARAAGCLIFDATAPKTLADGAVVYPLSELFPKVIPLATCAGAGLLTPAENFIAVDVSATCHPILVKSPVSAMTRGVPERFAAMVRAMPPAYTTVGLYTDGDDNCGPLAQATVSTKKGAWTSY